MLSKVKEIVSFGAYTLIGHVSHVLHDNVINVMINLFWGPSHNAIYAVGMKFRDLMGQFFYESAWTLSPTFTDLAAKNDQKRLRELFFIFTKGMVIASVPLCVFLIVFHAPILYFWVGPDFSEAGALMLISVAPLIIALPVSASANFPNAFGEIKTPSLVSVFTSVISIALAYALAKPLGMGLKGIVTAISLVSFLYWTGFSVTYACKISHISLREYWIDAYIKPASWTLAFWGAGLAALGSRLTQDFLSVFFFMVLAAMVGLYILGSYVWTLNRQEKGYLKSFLIK